MRLKAKVCVVMAVAFGAYDWYRSRKERKELGRRLMRKTEEAHEHRLKAKKAEKEVDKLLRRLDLLDNTHQEEIKKLKKKHEKEMNSL